MDKQITITKEEFKDKASTAIVKMIDEEDDVQLALLEALFSAKAMRHIEKQLFGEEKIN